MAGFYQAVFAATFRIGSCCPANEAIRQIFGGGGYERTATRKSVACGFAQASVSIQDSIVTAFAGQRRRVQLSARAPRARRVSALMSSWQPLILAQPRSEASVSSNRR